MELQDALLVSFLGYMTVFIGLVLTSLIIYAFAAVPKWMEALRSRGEPEAPVKKAAPVEDVEADVLAVITAVLEIERRLYFSHRVSKFTFSERRRPTGLI